MNGKKEPNKEQREQKRAKSFEKEATSSNYT